jgi:hypothetical protein
VNLHELNVYIHEYALPLLTPKKAAFEAILNHLLTYISYKNTEFFKLPAEEGTVQKPKGSVTVDREEAI